MWTLINDCGKQLTLHSKLREKNDGQVKVYHIIEVEFDQYKLELITENELPAKEEVRMILNCEQVMEYHFEVETV